MNTLQGLVALDTPHAVINFALMLGALALVFWLIFVIIGKMSLGPTANRAALIVLGIVAILVLLRIAGIY